MSAKVTRREARAMIAERTEADVLRPDWARSSAVRLMISCSCIASCEKAAFTGTVALHSAA